jgi:UDP-4-amino-4,6-dideoxy-N-acetyl-beta-L-altrosamine N-acetyltransferase
MGSLRPMTKSDLQMVLNWRNHPDVRKMMYSQHLISADEHESWWTAQQSRLDRRHMLFEADGKPIGVVSFTAIDRENRKAEWAFYAALPAPKGTGRMMEEAALEYAFKELGLNKLCCEVLRQNRRVIELHLSFGFRVEGVFRDHVCINGVYSTAVRLAILARNWRERGSREHEKLNNG